MTVSIADGAWLFRNFDTYDDVTRYRLTFVRWITLGDRHDLAEVEIVDPWFTHLGVQVSRAAFAARHVGVDLRALDAADIPAHVHLLTTDPQFLDAGVIPEGGLQRTAWATVEPGTGEASSQPT